MRLPYLQVTQETWSKARMLAAALGVSEGDAFLIICNLWAWGLDLGQQDHAPTGTILSKHAVALMAGAVGWKGDNDFLFEVLLDLGLVEKLEGGLRVRGMNRYETAWNKKQRDRDRAALGREAQRHLRVVERPTQERRDDAAPESPGQTYTQTQTQTQKLPSEARKYVPSIPEKPEKPDSSWTSDDFVAYANAKRFEEGLPPDKRFNFREVASWWSMVAMTGFTAQDLRLGFVEFGNDPYWVERKLPIKAFVSQWEKYVRKTEVLRAP